MEDWKVIAGRAGAYDERILELERERDQLLRQDPEYAAYLERCDMHGTLPGKRLSIRHFHRWLDRMRYIGENEPSDPDQAQVYWLRRRREYMQVESELLLRR